MAFDDTIRRKWQTAHALERDMEAALTVTTIKSLARGLGFTEIALLLADQGWSKPNVDDQSTFQEQGTGDQAINWILNESGLLDTDIPQFLRDWSENSLSENFPEYIVWLNKQKETDEK